LFVFAAAGICQEKTISKDLMQKIGQSTVNWSAGYIEAMGIGAPAEKTVAKPALKPMALRAAKENALQNLLGVTQTVQVDAARKIGDFTRQSSIANTQLMNLLQRAMLVEQKYMGDGTVEVKMRIPLYGELATIVMPLPSEKRTEEVPAQATAKPPDAVMYSGLVVDARGIGARPAMMPKIFAEDGSEIYGQARVETQRALQQGMAGYTRDIEEARRNHRVAVNPLTVKAIRTAATGKTDLVISNDDSAKFRAAAQSAILLQQCRVMIVLD